MEHLLQIPVLVQKKFGMAPFIFRRFGHPPDKIRKYWASKCNKQYLCVVWLNIFFFINVSTMEISHTSEAILFYKFQHVCRKIYMVVRKPGLHFDGCLIDNLASFFVICIFPSNSWLIRVIETRLISSPFPFHLLFTEKLSSYRILDIYFPSFILLFMFFTPILRHFLME